MGDLVRKKQSRETANLPLDIPRACLFSTTTTQKLGIKASPLIPSFPPLSVRSLCLPPQPHFPAQVSFQQKVSSSLPPCTLLLTQRSPPSSTLTCS